MDVKILKGEEGGCSSVSSYKPRNHLSTTNLLKLSHRIRISIFALFSSLICRLDDIPYTYWKSLQLLKILYLDGFGITKLPNSFRCLVGL